MTRRGWWMLAGALIGAIVAIALAPHFAAAGKTVQSMLVWLFLFGGLGLGWLCGSRRKS